MNNQMPPLQNMNRINMRLPPVHREIRETTPRARAGISTDIPRCQGDQGMIFIQLIDLPPPIDFAVKKGDRYGNKNG